MKTLKELLEGIQEKFVIGFDDEGDYIEIFKNPTGDKIISVSNFGREKDALRFIADLDNRDVYIASTDIIHQTIAKEANLNWNEVKTRFFPGIAYFWDRVLVVDYEFLKFSGGLYNLDKIIEDILDGEYDFLRKFRFDIEELKEKVISW